MFDPSAQGCSMPGDGSSNSGDINGSSESNMSMNINSGMGGAGQITSAAGNGGMTYARALNDAKMLIVQQSARIKADAQKLKAQSDEVAQLRWTVDTMSGELERLRALEPRLAEVAAGREQAESIVGRQRMEIESLETASRELQRMLGEQAARINELTGEIEQLRSHLPTDEDAAALEQMASLLSNARARSRQRAEAVDSAAPSAAKAPAAMIVGAGGSTGRLDRESGPAMAREHFRQQQAQSRHPQEIVIPAEPTPFCVVADRRAA